MARAVWCVFGAVQALVSAPVSADVTWIEAGAADARHHLVPFDNGKLAVADVDAADPWIRFDRLALRQHTELSIRFARGSAVDNAIDPMTLSVYAGDRDGPLVGFFDLHSTGSWNHYHTRRVRLAPLHGETRLYLSFTGAGGVNIEKIGYDTATIPARDPPDGPDVGACINLGGALEAPRETAPHYWGLQITPSDLDAIAAAGFESVRLPVRWSDYADSRAPYTIDPALFATVDSVIASATHAGLKVILDVHHYRALNHDPATHRERFLGLWAQIAAHYADYSNGELLFEILNEPHGNMTIALTDEINALALDVIRQTNPTRWVVLATGVYGGLDGLRQSTPVSDPNVVLSLHYYEPFDFSHQGAEFTEDPPPFGVTWGSAEDRARVEKDFQVAAYWRNQWGRPLFLGEFGVIRNANTDGVGPDKLVPNRERAKWVKHIRQTADAHGIAWCYWDYATTFSAYDKEEAVWQAEMLDALFD